MTDFEKGWNAKRIKKVSFVLPHKKSIIKTAKKKVSL